jgi:thiol:disulfide interchange protein DsbC
MAKILTLNHLAVALIAGLLSMQAAVAEEQSAAQNTAAVTQTASVATPDSGAPDLSKLQAALGGATPDSVADSSLPGLYEVTIGAQILYLSQDGRYVIQGDIVDLTSSDNITENRRNGLRADAIDKVGEDKMIIFGTAGEPKYTITVFTDIDCGYCRKLHQEIASYNDLGIKVRYLMFPRTGLNSESYDKAVSAWCSDDRNEAITRAKRGETLEAKTCENPVSQHYNLGQQLGVRGTPSIILADGEMVPGYVPADRLVEMLSSK